MASKTIINRKKYIRRPIPPRTNNAVVTTELIHSIVKVAVSDAVNEKFDTLNEKLDKIVSGQQKNSEIKDVDVRLAELRGRKDYRKIILRCVHQVTGYHCKLGVSITQQEGDSVRITQDEIKKRLPFIEDDVIYALIQQYLKNTHEDESLQEIAPPGLQKVAPGDENDFEDESEDEAATNSSTTKKNQPTSKTSTTITNTGTTKTGTTKTATTNTDTTKTGTTNSAKTNIGTTKTGTTKTATIKPNTTATSIDANTNMNNSALNNIKKRKNENTDTEENKKLKAMNAEVEKHTTAYEPTILIPDVDNMDDDSTANPKESIPKKRGRKKKIQTINIDTPNTVSATNTDTTKTIANTTSPDNLENLYRKNYNTKKRT